MSDLIYNEIYKHDGVYRTLEDAEFNFHAMATLMDVYKSKGKLEQFAMKTAIINSMADVEISLKQLKKVIGISDPIGSGILVSAKRKKIDYKITKIREEKNVK